MVVYLTYIIELYNFIYMLSDSEESSLLFDLYFWLSCVQFVPKTGCLDEFNWITCSMVFFNRCVNIWTNFFYDLIIIEFFIDESSDNYIMFEQRHLDGNGIWVMLFYGSCYLKLWLMECLWEFIDKTVLSIRFGYL